MTGFSNVASGAFNWLKAEAKNPAVDTAIASLFGDIVTALETAASKTSTPVDNLLIGLFANLAGNYLTGKATVAPVDATKLNQ